MSSIFVLTTDHGTHSADQWADMLSQMVFPISPDIAQHKVLEAKQAQLAIAQALKSHCQDVLNNERQHLQTRAAARFLEPHDGISWVEEAVKAVIDIVSKTQWSSILDAAVDVIRDILCTNFNSMQNVERLHFADKNPHVAEGNTYRAQIHGI